jgi:hypothetical protein
MTLHYKYTSNYHKHEASDIRSRIKKSPVEVSSKKKQLNSTTQDRRYKRSKNKLFRIVSFHIEASVSKHFQLQWCSGLLTDLLFCVTN